MRNHIAFKFIAIILCALVLTTAVGSGAGILLLSDYNLYNRSVDEAKEEALSGVRENFAQALMFRFASMELGGCSSTLMDAYYGDSVLYDSFRWGRYAYSIRDGKGNVMVEIDREIPNAVHYEIPMENARFVCLLAEKKVNPSAPSRWDLADPAMASGNVTDQDGATLATEQIQETLDANSVTAATGEAASETVASGETAPVEETAAGEAPTEEAAAEEAPAEETPAEEAPAEEAPAEETPAEEAPAEEAPAEEAPAEEAAAEEAAAEEAPAEEAPAEEAAAEEAPAEEAPAEEVAAEEAPAEEAPAEETPAEGTPAAGSENSQKQGEPTEATQPVAEAETQAVKMPVKAYYTRDQHDAAFNYQYYDYSAEEMKEATLCYANTSDYIVDLYLAPDAMYDHQIWDLLYLIAPWRGTLILLLGVCLLLFAALMAYLFCAAGRKPGSDIAQATGFNRLPLDLYAVLGVAGGAGAVFLVQIGYELFANTLVLFAGTVGAACFLCCLLLVGFCFACAAQYKTEDGFLWKNTVVFRALRILWQILGWLWAMVCKKLPSVLRWLGNRLKAGCKAIGRFIDQMMSLMPVAWQWLLAASLVFLILCICFVSRSFLLILIGLVIAIGATLYGALCFGKLLDGVKRMRRGDLRTKVEDRILLGSFREFAEELNGLAGVVMVAADKQLKFERMKTELITNVSHDIKTPLTSIINYVDLMEKPHTEMEQDEYLEVLSRQSQRLKKLIDDLMEMSKASTGNLQTEITQVNATEAVMQALGEFSDKLDRAQLVPVFNPDKEEIMMMADGRLAWRVLSNLLGNVVKYALPGTRVYVDVMELEEDVVISVKNVSKEQLNISSEKLMERFVRGDVSRNTEGSGLGLNIAKSLMELQHGKLELLVDGDLFKVTLIFPKK